MSRALVIVDVQHDFCEGGSLPVTGGITVASNISDHVVAHGNEYAVIAATADWHVHPGAHWSTEPNYQDSWPVHCAVGSQGGQFRPELARALEDVTAIFRKGEYSAAYSGFEASAEINGQTVQLAPWLRDHKITEIDVVGLATDYCVRATALDAAREGFITRVLTELTAGVEPRTTAAALERMSEEGVEII